MSPVLSASGCVSASTKWRASDDTKRRPGAFMGISHSDRFSAPRESKDGEKKLGSVSDLCWRMERRVEQKSPERAALLVLPGEAAIAAHELSHRINAALHGTTRHTKEAVRKQTLSYLQRYEDVQQYVGQGMKLHKDTPKRQTCEAIRTLARWRTALRLMPEERRLEALLEQGRTPDADSIWISRWLADFDGA